VRPLRIEPIEAGHINLTYRVEATEGVFALQWVNPIFGPEVHLDIEALSARLVSAGMPCPRLVRARDSGLWIAEPAGGVWRVMTWIEGTLLVKADGPARCGAAGRLLGLFHAALWDAGHRFHHARVGVHDTPRHLQALRAALAGHPGHRLHAEVSALGEPILAQAEARGPLPELPARVVHGDPKISNLVFGPDGRGRALIDLDTLARMPLPLELGDAFRSWCSPRGEDEEPVFELGYFEAGLAGWAETVGGRPTPGERRAIPDAVELIALELAARFATDALEERYFGWDRTRFSSAGEHNLARARSQLALARSIRAERPALERLTREILG
jgi:Ser/Thr protein kinase RdoA (MazF antagonist)